jgi:hypothetical protein
MEITYSDIKGIRGSKRVSQKMMGYNMSMVVSDYGKIERGQAKFIIGRLKQIGTIPKTEVIEILNYHKSFHIVAEFRVNYDR